MRAKVELVCRSVINASFELWLFMVVPQQQLSHNGDHANNDDNEKDKENQEDNENGKWL